jgi:hypothetical protein
MRKTTRTGAKRATKTQPAGRLAEGGIGTLLALKVAHSVYRRWERLSETERGRLGALADEVKQRALDLRGRLDRHAAAEELDHASDNLAAALAAGGDVALGRDEIESLRRALASELERTSAERRRAA